MEYIDKLTSLLGFYESYTGTFGEQVIAPKNTKKALINAMGININEDALKQKIQVIEHSEWQNILPHVHIAKLEDSQHYLTISLLNNTAKTINWSIITELGKKIEKTVEIELLQTLNQHKIDGNSFTQYQLSLPILEQGYHQLTINHNDIKSTCPLIYAPKTCFNHKEISEEKVWGYTAQLYSLNSDNNWGIGDFSDLCQLSEQASKQHASLIGLNPLHALFKHNPAHRSPYSPSSRIFLNPLYIDVTNVINFKSCKSAQILFASPDFQARLLAAKSSLLVDYPAVASLKYDILELLFSDFMTNNSDINPMTQDFENFKLNYGEELREFSTFDALYEYFNTLDSTVFNWNNWPVEYKTPNSDAVKQFQIDHSDRVEYFSFLQWIAHNQLSAASKIAKQNMSIGLYLDLAVGCDGSGADVWSNQATYVAGASIGAPPDNMNALGQNWGLTPISPMALQSQGYKPLVKTLHSIMQYAGAIRIDHILGLMRQYWIAPNMAANEGMYINFPFDDILRIIALESRRNQCIVIGEDLGNVPEGFSRKINDAGLLSFKVMFFERWDSGLFKRPDTYPEMSVSTIATHDTATLTGWWQGRDLQWRQQLNLYPNQDAENTDQDSRNGDRQKFIAALSDLNVIDNDIANNIESSNMTTELSVAVQKYLACSPSHIQLIPLEDVLELPEQVNIPGTIDEHPNWLQKLPVMQNNMWEVDSVKKIAQAMRESRPIK